MANDRLYLRCRQCGEIMLLAKHFLGSWSFRRTEKEMQEFFDEHFICGGDEDWWGHTFDLVSEMGEGYPEIDDYIPKENGHYYGKISNWTIERKTEKDEEDEQC